MMDHGAWSAWKEKHIKSGCNSLLFCRIIIQFQLTVPLTSYFWTHSCHRSRAPPTVKLLCIEVVQWGFAESWGYPNSWMVEIMETTTNMEDLEIHVNVNGIMNQLMIERTPLFSRLLVQFNADTESNHSLLTKTGQHPID